MRIASIEKRYKVSEDKIRELDTWLPRLKQQIREFFELSNSVRAVFLQVDDFYHLARADQPLVVDYIHRLLEGPAALFQAGDPEACQHVICGSSGAANRSSGEE